MIIFVSCYNLWVILSVMLLQVYMNNKQIGGRGYKSPFPTNVRRVPMVLNKQVDNLIDSLYEDMKRDVELPFLYVSSLPTALDRCKGILACKKSARKSLEMLLKSLYDNQDISL